VNLAGATLAEGRLTASRKARILSSRIEATATLVAAWRRCERPPRFWFQASATGYYGDAGEADVAETHPPASDFFLADVCRAWEAEAERVLDDVGPDAVRLVIGRLGLVLAPDAPAWQKLLAPVRWGAGGRLGSGRQWWAWIHAEDVARVILELADRDETARVYNVTAPEPVRQAELVRRVARRLGRPSFLPAPAFALRLVLGEMADALLLPSCRALPVELERAGFAFRLPTLESVLDALFG
jgi:uncharacterized protein